MSHNVPDRPWQKVGIDLLTHKSIDYVITVDYFSNFWEIDKLNRTTSNAVIKKIKALFSRYGIPTTVMTDNGPQFTAEEFRKFAQKYDIEHVTSSTLPAIRWESGSSSKISQTYAEENR